MALITRLSSPSGDEPPACQLCAWLCGGEGEDRAHSWALIGTDLGRTWVLVGADLGGESLAKLQKNTIHRQQLPG